MQLVSTSCRQNEVAFECPHDEFFCLPEGYTSGFFNGDEKMVVQREALASCIDPHVARIDLQARDKGLIAKIFRKEAYKSFPPQAANVAMKFRTLNLRKTRVASVPEEWFDFRYSAR